MTAPVSDERESIRDSVRSFLQSMGPVHRFRAVLDGASALDRDQWQTFAQLGALQILVPEENGGLGLSLRDALAVAEELGRSLHPAQLVGGAWQATVLLEQLVSAPLRCELLRRIATGSSVVGVAWQAAKGEAGAVIDTKERLQGTMRYVAPGPKADGWLVAAMRAGQQVLVWVPATAAGLKVTPVERTNGSTLAHLHFEAVEFEPSHLLASGESVGLAVSAANDAARFGYAAEMLGVGRGALALTVEYLKTREQFGRPIGSFQAMQHKAVDVLLQVELAAACLADAADVCAGDPARLGVEAARAKARASDAALAAARFCIQAHGAMGVTHECDAGLYLKRALHLTTHLATPGELRRVHIEMLNLAGTPAEDLPVTELPDGVDLEEISEAEFRAGIRDFVRRNCPSGLLHLSHPPTWPEYKPWYQALAKKGWIAPAWPREHGGLSLSPARLLAFYEEIESLGVTKGNELGLSMIGPLLIRFGTPAQKEFYLPRILSGEHVWCQGYSEPGSGSDLASLRTAAVLDGNEYVISGQKIWTTFAMHATHIFMLARTARMERKQDGISMLLVPLDAPGIRVRPIKDVGGHEKFCEIFFDEARVPTSSVLGEVNKGWEVAKALLGYERLMIGSPNQSLYMLGQLRRLGVARELFAQPAFAEEFVQLELDVRDLQALYRHFAAIYRRGEPIPPSIALLKIAATETWRRLCDRFVEHAGEAGGSVGLQSAGEFEFDPVAQLMRSLPGPIYGGTNEIQRNILAKAVLGLPG